MKMPTRRPPRPAQISETIKAMQAKTIDDHLVDLVSRFSAALLEKLRDSERKYKHASGWTNPDWDDHLRREIRKHIDKGDPRDVAAYCAFAWHHSWSLADSTKKDSPNGR